MRSRLRLLVIDDDEVDRLAVMRLVRGLRMSTEVEERADLTSALSALQADGFDCVLLDYNLPGTDGLEILKRLRRSDNNVPVIVLTGQGDEELAVSLMKAGAADYLNKNALSAERLERSLRYALDLHQAQCERAQLLEREQRAREEAQAANHAKDEFLATVSHELRTPLNAILGWSRLLCSGNLDEHTSVRAIEIIDRNARHQARLIEDLLEISRIISGKLRLDLRATVLSSIIDAAVESVRPAAEARRIELDIEPVKPHVVLCDPSRMQQVFWNLLTNAIKFTPEEGRVRVRVSRRGTDVVVAVTDTGLGIDPDFLPYVFDRFRQQDGASTRAHGGLGLGLAIVRHLVELHGGRVDAQSPGHGLGSTFTVRVPLTTAAADFAGAAAALDRDGWPIELPALDGIKVLVVDNDPDTRGLLKAVLEGCGANVEEASSVGEALMCIGAARPDVLLSDIAMPGEDGYSLIRRVRAIDQADRTRYLPAAAFTACATSQDRARALLAGFQAHIAKPVEPSELAAVVAALAGRTAVKG